jgi:hypothetical protein
MVFNVVPTAFEVSPTALCDLEERQLLRCSFALREQPEQRTGSHLYSGAQQSGAAAAARGAGQSLASSHPRLPVCLSLRQVALVGGILAYKCGPAFAALTGGTIAAYTAFTLAITQVGPAWLACSDS